MTAPSPTFGTVNTGTSGSGGVSVSMPASIAAGDLLLVIVSHDTSASVTASAGWLTVIGPTLNSSSLTVFGKIAAGGDTCTITTTANDYVILSTRITGHAVTDVVADIFDASATGTSATADPPSLATGYTQDWLWFALCAIDMSASNNTLSAAPSGYTSATLTKSASSTTSCALGVAWKQSTAASTEDPGGFTNTSRPWVAFTLGIPSAVLPGPQLRNISSTSGSGDLTVTKPTGVVDDDLLVGFMSGDVGFHGATTVPSGWNSIDAVDNGSDGMIGRTFWKIASSEGANYTFTFGSTGTTFGTIYAFKAGTFDPTNPINAHSLSDDSGSTASVTAPGVTTDVANCYAVAMFGAYAIATSFTPPSGWTERSDISSNSWGAMSTATKMLTSTGATGNLTATASGSHNSNAAVGGIVAIAPAPSVSKSITDSASMSMTPRKATLAVQTYLNETFTGNDGDGWDSTRWPTASVSTGATATIQGNKGKLATGTLGAYNDFILKQCNAAANVDVRVHFTDFVSGSTNENYVGFRVRSDSSGQNYLQFQIDPSGSGSAWEISRINSGVRTDITSATLVFAAGDTAHMRVVANGSTVDFYIWKNNSLEPTTPTYTLTDSWFTSNTYFSVFLAGGNNAVAKSVSLDNITVTSAAPAPSTSFTASNIYWGAWIISDTGTQEVFDMTLTDAFVANAGKEPSIIIWSAPWYNTGGSAYYNFDTTAANTVRNRGAIPMFSWGSNDTTGGTSQPNFTLASIIRGDHDAFLNTWASQAGGWNHPFFLRLDWEMNGNWQPYAESTNTNKPNEFVMAWRHIYDIVAPQVPLAKWVWSPNLDHIGQYQDIAVLYPGDEYVDWIGFDGYNFGTLGDGWRTWDDLVTTTYRRLLQISPSKPIMCTETGAVESGGDKAAWFTDLFSKVPSNYPAIKAWCYSQYIDGSYNWKIESSTAAKNAFAAGVASSNYLTNNYSTISTIDVPTSGNVAKSITETGTASETLSVQVTLAVTDSAAETETPTYSSSFAVSDSPTESGLLSFLCQLPLTDSGSLTELLTPAPSVGITDVGTGFEQFKFGLSVTDNATASDALAAQVTLPTADSVAASDGAAPAPIIGVQENGTLTDSPTITGTTALSDNGTGTDAVSVAPTSLVSITDSGATVDALALNVAIPVTETESATDVVSAQTGSNPFATDSGAASEALTLAITNAVQESVAATDVPTERTTFSVTDSASETETLTAVTGAAPNVTDSVAATEAIALQVQIAVPDSVAQSENGVYAATLAVTEAESATDVVTASSSTFVAITDSATASEALAITVLTNVADTATEADNLGQQVNAVFADLFTQSEQVIIGVTYLLLDSIAASDHLAVVQGGAIPQLTYPLRTVNTTQQLGTINRSMRTRTERNYD